MHPVHSPLHQFSIVYVYFILHMVLDWSIYFPPLPLAFLCKVHLMLLSFLLCNPSLFLFFLSLKPIFLVSLSPSSFCLPPLSLYHSPFSSPYPPPSLPLLLPISFPLKLPLLLPIFYPHSSLFPPSGLMGLVDGLQSTMEYAKHVMVNTEMSNPAKIMYSMKQLSKEAVAGNMFNGWLKVG